MGVINHQSYSWEGSGFSGIRTIEAEWSTGCRSTLTLLLISSFSRENSHLLLAKHSPVICFEITRYGAYNDSLDEKWKFPFYVDFMVPICQMFQVATYHPNFTQPQAPQSVYLLTLGCPVNDWRGLQRSTETGDFAVRSNVKNHGGIMWKFDWFMTNSWLMK